MRTKRNGKATTKPKHNDWVKNFLRKVFETMFEAMKLIYFSSRHKQIESLFEVTLLLFDVDSFFLQWGVKNKILVKKRKYCLAPFDLTAVVG